jgi:integrase/recombinase XerD
MLTAERGAAAHTVEAYTRDLSEFLALLAAKGKTARTATPENLRAFLAGLARKGLAPTSRARKLSAIRQFFRFLLTEGLRKDDPCSAIDSPRLPRPLPKILSFAEVETLLDTAAGASDRAVDGAARRRALRLYGLLETLYATGLRVSELISLPRGVLVADDRVLTIKGKGGRERLVPLNDAARNALAAHIAAVEEDEANGRTKSPWLFPSSEGQHLTRQRFGQELKALAIAAGIERARLAARATSCFCQPSPRAWRRSSHGAAAPRPRRHFDDADLHPCHRGAAEKARRRASSACSGAFNQAQLNYSF